MVGLTVMSAFRLGPAFSLVVAIAVADPSPGQRGLFVRTPSATPTATTAPAPSATRGFPFGRIVGGSEVTISEDSVWPEDDYELASLTVSNASTLTVAGGSTIRVSESLVVTAGSTLTLGGVDVEQQIGGAWVGGGVFIDATEVIVELGAKIAADGQGYTGAVTGPGRGPGGGQATADGGGGGGHGGRGGDGRAAAGGTPYGDPLQPTTPGSGGGGDLNDVPAGRAGSGGGVIRLVTRRLVLDGTVTANGAPTTARNKGGGGGGSIWLTVGEINGDGSLHADGGSGMLTAGSGGGGRIALYYESDEGFTGFAQSTATPADAFAGATRGTTGFLETSTANPHLHVFERFEIPSRSRHVYRAATVHQQAELEIGGGSVIDTEGQFEILRDGRVTLQGIDTERPAAGRWSARGVRIRTRDFVVATGAALSADEQGYTGAVAGRGGGPGGGGATETDAGGGSHGGLGGAGRNGSAGAPVYDSELIPEQAGSGGGGDLADSPAGRGASGGGVVHVLVQRTMTIDGSIRADGGDEPLGNKGGGAGGSILVHARAVMGSGSIAAGGGNASLLSGAGGGGRIAVHTWGEPSPPQIDASAAGGTASGSGGDGTVVFNQTPVFTWFDADFDLFHDVEYVEWASLAADSATLTDIVAVARGDEIKVALNLPSFGYFEWDTRGVADGIYDLIARFHDSVATHLGETTRSVLVNNSVAWHSGRIDTDQTWQAGVVHVVEGDLTIAAGISLTIEPGAVVKLVNGTQIQIATGATLDAMGTETDGIVLTAFSDDAVGGDSNLDEARSAPQPGAWRGIVIAAGGALLVNDFTEVRYAQAVHSGALTGGETWAASTVHIVSADVVIPSGESLLIEPGAVVKFADDSGLRLQANSRLQALGTPSLPVVFTSLRDDSVGGDSNGDGTASLPQPGTWTGITFDGAQGTIEQARFYYGGGSPSGVWQDSAALRTTGSAQLDLSSSIIAKSFFDGVLAQGGEVSIINTVLYGNDRALVAWSGDSSLRAVHVTLDDNRIGALGHGGALEITNAVIGHSLAAGVQYDFGPPIAIRYSNVFNTPGSAAVHYNNLIDPTGVEGNISAAPAYRDRARYDFRPAFASPVIDAADGSVAPDADFDGSLRYDDPRTPNTGVATSAGAFADLGAFELVEIVKSQIDLVPSNVTGPSSAVAGEWVDVTWTIKNIGTDSAVGPWYEKVSLVEDPAFAPEPITAGEVIVARDVTLGPGQEIAVSARVRVPGGVVADHFWHVATNSRDSVFEAGNRRNNKALGAGAVALDLPEITIDGAPIQGVFSVPSEQHWFKLNPPAGADISVELTVEQAALYVARAVVPSASHFDLQGVAGDARYRARVADTATDTYYVLVQAPAPLVTGGSFGVSAATLGFQIDDVQPRIVGNSGASTVELRGAGFAPGVAVELVSPSGNALSAASVDRRTSANVFATFPMQGVETGLYDVRARVPGGPQVSLPDAIEVGESLPPRLDFSVTIASRLRAGRTASLMVHFANRGLEDVPLPLMTLRASTGELRPLRASVRGSTQLTFLAPAIGGLDVVPPGAEARVTLYYTAPLENVTVELDLFATHFGEAKLAKRPLDWDSFAEVLRPQGADETAWQEYLADERARYGDTYGDLYDFLGSQIRDLAADGVEATYVDGQWLTAPEFSSGPPVLRADVEFEPFLPEIDDNLATPLPSARLGGALAGKGDGIQKIRVVVIGNQDYRKVSDDPRTRPENLYGAARDAEKVKTLFSKTYNVPKESIQVLVDSTDSELDDLGPAAVKMAIATALSKADTDDLTVVWNSGHGCSPDRTNGEYRALYNTGVVTASEFNQILGAAVGPTLFVDDTCHSAGITGQITHQNVLTAAGADFWQFANDSTSFTCHVVAQLMNDPKGKLLDSFTKGADRLHKKHLNEEEIADDADIPMGLDFFRSVGFVRSGTPEQVTKAWLDRVKSTFDITDDKKAKRQLGYLQMLAYEGGSQNPAIDFKGNGDLKVERKDIKEPATTQAGDEQVSTGVKRASAQPEVLGSFDPNEKVGPAGAGPEGYLVPGEMLYTIYFENDPERATAPAQEVRVVDQLDPNLDWATFELAEMAFGDEVIDVPQGRQRFSGEVGLAVGERSIVVALDAQIDLQTGMATWSFTSIDPVIDDLPEDPLLGFLPPNDETGRGEGWISFRIRPHPGLPTGTEIRNPASIVFDLNQPIVTNTTVNTIDVDTPTSSVEPLAAVTRSASFAVGWSGTDSGAGIGSYDVYVSVDNGDFALWQERTEATSAIYPGELLHSYGFFSVAYDRAGNVEKYTALAEASTRTEAPVRGCVGDCDGDGNVSIAELIRGINIALGNALLDVCPSFDVNDNQTVNINELIQAINAALAGCEANSDASPSNAG